MSDRVAADVDGLRRLRKDIEQAQQTINEALRRLKASLAQANWDDAARHTFEQQLTDTISGLRQFHSKADELKSVLNRKIEALTAYLQR